MEQDVCSCVGLMQQGFGSREAAGVAFVGRCQKLPPHPTESMPASSKMDPSLAKAKPISDVGSTFVVT